MEIIMKTANVNITKRDLFIFEFIEVTGWVKFDLILKYLIKNNMYIDLEKYPEPMNAESLRVRLNLLHRAGYLRRIRFMDSNYYASTPLSSKNYELINSLNFNQADHDNYLISLVIDFSNYKFYDFDTQRMVKARYAVGEKTGPIPDLIYLTESREDAAYIEYELSDKSETLSFAKIDNLLSDSKRKFKNSSVLFICETDTIYKKYINVAKKYFEYDEEKRYLKKMKESGKFKENGDKIYEIENDMNIIFMKSSEVQKRFKPFLDRARKRYLELNPE
jgi:hypothetical protein